MYATMLLSSRRLSLQRMSSVCRSSSQSALRPRILSPAQPRWISTSAVHQQTTPVQKHSDPRQDYQVCYHGPLTQTFRRLKLFSLSSLALSSVMTPFIFIVESSLPISARLILAATALGTSSISTVLVGWAGAPYVVTLRRLLPAENGGIDGIEMTTLTLTLSKLTTRVYDTDFLVDTRRPFAKWELPKEVQLPSPSEDATMAAKAGPPGEVETVAETLDSKNEVIGRWVVKWGEGGTGSCSAVGKVVRYAIVFNPSRPLAQVLVQLLQRAPRAPLMSTPSIQDHITSVIETAFLAASISVSTLVLCSSLLLSCCVPHIINLLSHCSWCSIVSEYFAT